MSKRYAIAEHRQAYAGWCARQGVKQNHAVFVSHVEKLPAVLEPAADVVIMIEGWEGHPHADEIRARLGIERPAIEGVIVASGGPALPGHLWDAAAQRSEPVNIEDLPLSDPVFDPLFGRNK